MLLCLVQGLTLKRGWLEGRARKMGTFQQKVMTTEGRQQAVGTGGFHALLLLSCRDALTLLRSETALGSFSVDFDFSCSRFEILL